MCSVIDVVLGLLRACLPTEHQGMRVAGVGEITRGHDVTMLSTQKDLHPCPSEGTATTLPLLATSTDALLLPAASRS